MSDATPRIWLQPVNLRQRAVSLAVIMIVGVAAYVLWTDSPAESAWYPKSPLYHTTGLHCPGCGASRSMHHALHGRFTDAMQHNQLLIILGTPVIAMLLLSAVFALCFGRSLQLPFPRWWPTLLLLLILCWFVIRNIPGFEALQPPPVQPH